MPEGPEVRTIVSQLRAHVAGKRVVDLHFAKNSDRLFKDTTQKAVTKALRGQKIVAVHRHGKYIDFEFENTWHLVMHLLISGRLSLISRDGKLPRYFRFSLELDSGEQVCLGDKMQWTKPFLLRETEIAKHKNFTTLGVDVFSDDFTVAALEKILTTSKKSIHTLLLDQKKISGLGNIYVNEVLFLAGIHPQTVARDVPRDAIKHLYKHINEVLAHAFSLGGTTIEAFVERDATNVGWHTLDGAPGKYWQHMRVFQREGKPCPVCKTLVEKVKVGTRGAFFCPKCQCKN